MTVRTALRPDVPVGAPAASAASSVQGATDLPVSSAYGVRMVDEDRESETDLGDATIVYEGRDGETVEKTVPNEHIAYVQDHWILKTDTEGDRDVIRRIPAYRVYHVERSVEEFEEEIRTLRDRVQSLADDLRTRLPVGGGGEHATRHGESEVVHVEIESDDSEEEGTDQSR